MTSGNFNLDTFNTISCHERNLSISIALSRLRTKAKSTQPLDTGLSVGILWINRHTIDVERHQTIASGILLSVDFLHFLEGDILNSLLVGKWNIVSGLLLHVRMVMWVRQIIRSCDWIEESNSLISRTSDE